MKTDSKSALEEFGRRLDVICRRQGMYTGDNSLDSLSNYMNGMFEAMDACGVFSFREWRDWIQNRYPNNSAPDWATVVSTESPSEQAAIAALPSLFREFANARKNT